MIIGLILTILALGVLFDKLPGGLVSWLIVLICGVVLMVMGSGSFSIHLPRRQPPPSA